MGFRIGPHPAAGARRKIYVPLTVDDNRSVMSTKHGCCAVIPREEWIHSVCIRQEDPDREGTNADIWCEDFILSLISFRLAPSAHPGWPKTRILPKVAAQLMCIRLHRRKCWYGLTVSLPSYTLSFPSSLSWFVIWKSQCFLSPLLDLDTDQEYRGRLWMSRSNLFFPRYASSSRRRRCVSHPLHPI